MPYGNQTFSHIAILDAYAFKELIQAGLVHAHLSWMALVVEANEIYIITFKEILYRGCGIITS